MGVFMKKVLSLVLALVMVFAFASCSDSGYTSKYRATGMVRSSKNDSCSMKFNSLNGVVVLKTRKTVESDIDTIHWTASLEEGEISVYYATDDMEEKALLFTVTAGGYEDERGGEFECGEIIQIIIETADTARGGEFTFDFE